MLRINPTVAWILIVVKISVQDRKTLDTRTADVIRSGILAAVSKPWEICFFITILGRMNLDKPGGVFANFRVALIKLSVSHSRPSGVGIVAFRIAESIIPKVALGRVAENVGDIEAGGII
jgi:hypothetical protein